MHCSAHQRPLRALEIRDWHVRCQGLAGLLALVRALGSTAVEELRRVAGRVVVVLLPLLEEGHEMLGPAAEVLQELVAEHKHDLGGDTLRNLPPVPEVPTHPNPRHALSCALCAGNHGGLR